MRLFELDYSVMVDRLRSVYALAQRAEIEGERSSAELAFKRLLSSIARDYGQEKADAAERQVKASYGKKEPPKARTRRTYQEPPKREYSRQKQPPQSGLYTHNGWMFTILRFIDPSAGKRGSDKVWGYAMKDGQFVTFWGRFGKTIQTKKVDRHEANKKFQQKRDKGYKSVDADPIDYGYIFTQSEAW